MDFLRRFYGTTVGKKIVMALTGLILVGFVISHMVGNLKTFGGFDSNTGVYVLDHYAEALRLIAADFLGRETFLWLARAVLLGSLILHVLSAILLSKLNRQAKAINSKSPHYASSNAASRTMLYGGLFLLAFIVFHLLHFTTGNLHFNGFVEGKVYSNVYRGFESLPIVLVYVAAMAFLAMHLYHGAWSMFQTLGIDTPVWNNGLRTLAKIISIVLFLGFSSVPIAIACRLIPAPVVLSVAK